MKSGRPTFSMIARSICSIWAFTATLVVLSLNMALRRKRCKRLKAAWDATP